MLLGFVSYNINCFSIVIIDRKHPERRVWVISDKEVKGMWATSPAVYARFCFCLRNRRKMTTFIIPNICLYMNNDKYNKASFHIIKWMWIIHNVKQHTTFVWRSWRNFIHTYFMCFVHLHVVRKKKWNKIGVNKVTCRFGVWRRFYFLCILCVSVPATCAPTDDRRPGMRANVMYGNWCFH